MKMVLISVSKENIGEFWAKNDLVNAVKYLKQQVENEVGYWILLDLPDESFVESNGLVDWTSPNLSCGSFKIANVILNLTAKLVCKSRWDEPDWEDPFKELLNMAPESMHELGN